MRVLFTCINLKGSRVKVFGRIRERCHPSHRFLCPCHVAASRLFHKAFLLPFRMTIEGESVMMRGTIRRHNEGNVNRHPERMLRICTRGEKSRKMSFRVCRIPFPKHMIKYFA